MDNSNGTNIPPVVSSAIPSLNSAGTETYDSASATASAPPSLPASEIALIGNATFSTLADPAHASTELCFIFVPSISVQGRRSEVCDCGTTTAALTTQGSTTGCALSNSIFAIDQFPTETGAVTSSATKPATEPTTAAPIVTPPPCMYPRDILQRLKYMEADINITANPTRAFEIMFKDGTVDQIQLDAWSVYSHPIGEASKINACNGGFWASSAGPSVSFPTSLGPFTESTYSGCMYQGPATAPGSVTCPGLSKWTDCSTATATTQLCYNGAGYDSFIPQVECEF